MVENSKLDEEQVQCPHVENVFSLDMHNLTKSNHIQRTLNLKRNTSLALSLVHLFLLAALVIVFGFVGGVLVVVDWLVGFFQRSLICELRYSKV